MVHRMLLSVWKGWRNSEIVNVFYGVHFQLFTSRRFISKQVSDVFIFFTVNSGRSLRRTASINSPCSSILLGADGWKPHTLNCEATIYIIRKYLNGKLQARYYVLCNLVQTWRSSALQSWQIYLQAYPWCPSTLHKNIPNGQSLQS